MQFYAQSYHWILHWRWYCSILTSIVFHLPYIVSLLFWSDFWDLTAYFGLYDVINIKSFSQLCFAWSNFHIFKTCSCLYKLSTQFKKELYSQMAQKVLNLVHFSSGGLEVNGLGTLQTLFILVRLLLKLFKNALYCVQELFSRPF